MPLFELRCREGGELSRRQVQAPDAAAAMALAQSPGLTLLGIRELTAPARLRRRPARARFSLRLFAQELAVLLAAGLPLLEALQTLREQQGPSAGADILGDVCRRLQDGEPLSAALQSQPDAFDALFVAVMAAAERTGQAVPALRAHAAYLAWTERLRSALTGAALYPALLLAASTAVLGFLLLFVVPRFAGVLDSLGGEVPGASAWLLHLGVAAGERPWLAIGLIGMLLALPLLAAGSARVRQAVADALWRLPGLGPRLRVLALARLYRTVGLLLRAGVPAVPALRSAADVATPRLAGQVRAVAEALGRGLKLSDAMAAQALATPVALRMLRVGESSGELGAMLEQAATFHDEELSRVTDMVTRLVNPVLMLLMGGLIGSVVVLLYLPIFQLAERVS